MVAQYPFIAVYIVTNRRNGTLYIGVTSQLISRILQHREGRFEGFTKRYGLRRLVWFEQFELMTNAIAREKAIKEWRRDWKIMLIERDNPNWDDLFLELTAAPAGPLSHLNPNPDLN